MSISYFPQQVVEKRFHAVSVEINARENVYTYAPYDIDEEHR